MFDYLLDRDIHMLLCVATLLHDKNLYSDGTPNLFLFRWNTLEKDKACAGGQMIGHLCSELL